MLAVVVLFPRVDPKCTFISGSVCSMSARSEGYMVLFAVFISITVP